MSYTTAQFVKLPVWAQREIEKMQYEIAEAKDAITAMQSDHPQTGVSVSHGIYQDIVQYIDAVNGVDFTIKQNDVVNTPQILNVRIEKGALVLRATGHPTQITVKPQASNDIRVGLTDD